MTIADALAAGRLVRTTDDRGTRITTPDERFVVWECCDRLYRYRWALSREARGWHKSKGQHGGAARLDEVLARLEAGG